MWYNLDMNRKKTDRAWYSLITKGMGITVCTASLALFVYLFTILAVHGPDLTLAGFFLVPVITFTAGCLCIKISALETIEPGEKEAQPMAKKIGILSDTHGLLRPEAEEILRGCDAIIHAGDIDSEAVLQKLRAIAPLYIVKGNNDKGDWAGGLDERLYVQLGGLRFFIVHNRRFVPGDLGSTDVVIFGHSHKYFCETKEGVLWLNPGSCGRRRFSLPVTMAAIEIDEKRFEVIRYDLDRDLEKSY